MGFPVKSTKTLKHVLLVSIAWGAFLPFFIPLVINIGPTRVMMDGVTVVSEKHGLLSSYFSLIEFYGVKEIFLLWFELFATCSVIVFILCFTCFFVMKRE
jgi:hypothetical protein